MTLAYAVPSQVAEAATAAAAMLAGRWLRPHQELTDTVVLLQLFNLDEVCLGVVWKRPIDCYYVILLFYHDQMLKMERNE